MNPQDIQEGGIYERDDGGAICRRNVTEIDRSRPEEVIVLYIEDGYPDFTWLEEFARWADRRIV